MRKFTIHFLLPAIGLTAVSFAAVGNEGTVSAVAENRWTARRDPYDQPLRYVLLGNPGPTDRVVAYERRHFGWPMWVLYVDGPAGDGTWYAKLDLYKLAVNFAAACTAALGIAAILTIFRRWRRERPAASVQPGEATTHQEPVGEPTGGNR